jgi:hypothetical protein
MTNEDTNDISLIFFFVGGVHSTGSGMDFLSNRFQVSSFLKHRRCVYHVCNYGRLFLWVGRIPFVRNIVAKYVYKDIEGLCMTYKKAKVVVVAHSFGTWCIGRLLGKWYNTGFGKARIDLLILCGSVIKQSFDWSKFREIDVYNFVGKSDSVVFASPLWGTGWSGRYGFTQPTVNLSQYRKDWGHSDYVQGWWEFLNIIRNFIDKKVRI